MSERADNNQSVSFLIHPKESTQEQVSMFNLQPKDTTTQHLTVGLVLGAAVRQDGSPSISMRRRVARAVTLWQAGQVDRLMMCGGKVWTGRAQVSEASLMAVLATTAGVDAEAIILEEQSQTTRQNARYGLDLAARHRAHAVVVVTESFHLPRAMWIFSVVNWQGHRRGDWPRFSLSGVGARRDQGHWSLLLLVRESLALVADLVRVWRA